MQKWLKMADVVAEESSDVVMDTKQPLEDSMKENIAEEDNGVAKATAGNDAVAQKVSNSAEWYTKLNSLCNLVKKKL